MAENLGKVTVADMGSLQGLSGLLDTLAPVVLSVDTPRLHDEGEVARLLGSVLHGCGERVCPVVHFTSAYAGEGSGGLAFDVAAMAARHSGKRTLFLNMNVEPEANFAEVSQNATLSINAFFQADKPHASPLLMLQGTSLFYADFSKSRASVAASINVELIRNLLAALRQNFDLVVLASEAAASTGVPMMMGSLVDGTVLVLEAERVRAPVVEELRQQVEVNGGRFLGAVLNRRRFYIPRWVYRLFLGGRGR